MEIINGKILKHTIIKCKNKNCKQLLRIPVLNKKLLVKCPKCGYEFKYLSGTFFFKVKSWTITQLKDHPILCGIYITIFFCILAYQYYNYGLTFYSVIINVIYIIFLWIVSIILLNLLRDDAETKWYYRKWFVFLALIFLPPLGIVLMWLGKKFKKIFRIALSILFGSFFILSLMNQRKHYHLPEEFIAEIIKGKRNSVFLPRAAEIDKYNFISVMRQRPMDYSGKNLSIPTIVKKFGRCVIHITTMNKRGKIIAQGTGFLISEDGCFVTCHHIVEDAYKLIIRLADGTKYEDILLLYDFPKYDLSILKINCPNRVFDKVVIGNSENIQEGEKVVTIGNPAGLENTVSEGIISGLRKKSGMRLIQITAPVSPGSSGSPLFNTRGEVIGIITVGSYLYYQNLNFAIPIDTLLKLLDKEEKLSQITNTKISQNRDVYNLPFTLENQPDNILQYKPFSLPTGTILVDKQTEKGLGILTIENGTKYDAVVKLSLNMPKVNVKTVYIRAKDTYEIRNIPEGVYTVKFCLGEDWNKQTKKFNKTYYFFKFLDVLEFEEYETYDSIQYKKFHITLHRVPHGRAITQTITEKEFFDDE